MNKNTYSKYTSLLRVTNTVPELYHAAIIDVVHAVGILEGTPTEVNMHRARKALNHAILVTLQQQLSKDTPCTANSLTTAYLEANRRQLQLPTWIPQSIPFLSKDENAGDSHYYAETENQLNYICENVVDYLYDLVNADRIERATKLFKGPQTTT